MTKDFLKSDFMVLCFAALILFLYPVVVFPKGELELLINKYHNPGLDLFFTYVTHLGDGTILAVLLLILLFINYTTAIVAAISIAFQAIIISIFKRWLYKGLERPIAFFDENVSLNFVDGVDVHSYNTFPSGHTATGFALFALIFIVIKNRSIIKALLLFLLAFSIGFSRVYLLQHFVVDVYFGAIFGVISVMLGLWLFEFMFRKEQIHKFDRSSLQNFFFKKSR